MTQKPLTDQPSALPTRKLTVAAMVGPAATEAWAGIMAAVYPPLVGPEVSMLIGALVTVAAGYWVRDRENT